MEKTSTYTDVTFKRNPVGGPSTWEEAMNDLDASENDIDAGHGTSWDTVKQMMEERISSNAGQVYR